MNVRATVPARRVRGACAACVLAVAFAAACSQGPRQREEAVAATGHADSAIGLSAAVAQLRSPDDSTRLIYTRPTPLGLPAATAAGKGNLTTPYGISTPDTSHGGPGLHLDTSAAHGATAARPAPGTRPPPH